MATQTLIQVFTLSLYNKKRNRKNNQETVYNTEKR